MRRICGSRRRSPVRGNGGIDRLGLLREACREHEAKPEAQTIWCVGDACGVDDALNVGLDGDPVAQLDLVTRLYRGFGVRDSEGRDGGPSDDGMGNGQPQAIVRPGGERSFLHGPHADVTGNGLCPTVCKPNSHPRRQPRRDGERRFQGGLATAVMSVPSVNCRNTRGDPPARAVAII